MKIFYTIQVFIDNQWEVVDYSLSGTPKGFEVVCDILNVLGCFDLKIAQEELKSLQKQFPDNEFQICQIEYNVKLTPLLDGDLKIIH